MPHHRRRVVATASALLVASLSASSGRATLVVEGALNKPSGVAFATNGTVYIVEMAGHRVSVLDRAGRLGVVAGTGEPGLSGDAGPAVKARLNSPHHLAFGPDGKLY